MLATPQVAGRLQVQTTRIQGQVFSNGAVPAGFDPLESETHDLMVNTYFVADDSPLIPGAPTLASSVTGKRRRRTGGC